MSGRHIYYPAPYSWQYLQGREELTQDQITSAYHYFDRITFKKYPGWAIRKIKNNGWTWYVVSGPVPTTKLTYNAALAYIRKHHAKQR